MAAAGNDGTRGSPRSFPADLPHVLTVASTDSTGSVSSFSTRGLGTDLAAPGEALPVAVPESFAPSGFTSVTGTSFAAPVVAGAAAWIWTQRPELDSTQVVELLRRSARDIGPPGRDPASGFGLLDLPRALAAPAPPSDPFEPNDDIDQVRPDGLIDPGRQPLTAPESPRASLGGRLDVAEDPKDVYRVWVPAGQRADAVLRSGSDLVLELWRPPRRRVSTSRARPGAGIGSRSARDPALGPTPSRCATARPTACTRTSA